MKPFKFTITLLAPSQNDAVEKMTSLQELGQHLNSEELKALAKTVSSPAALAFAKEKLGIK